MALGASRTARRLLALAGCVVVAVACAVALPSGASAADTTPPDAGFVGWTALTHAWYDPAQAQLWYNSDQGGSGTAKLYANDYDSPAVSVAWPSGPAAWSPSASTSTTNTDGAGLAAFYYAGSSSTSYASPSNFSTSGATAMRIEGQPQFSYNATTMPASSIPLGKWSARWIGKITAPEAGPYVFQVASDDAFRLFIDNVDVLSNWHSGGLATYTQCASTAISWGAASVHDVRLEYAQNTGVSSMEVRWRKPSDVATTQAPSGTCNFTANVDNSSPGLTGGGSATYPVVPTSAYTLGSGSRGGMFTRAYSWGPTAPGAATPTTVLATATNGIALTSNAMQIKLQPDELGPDIGGTGTMDFVDKPGGGWNAGSNANTLAFPVASDVTDTGSSAAGRGLLRRDILRRAGVPDGLGGCDTSSGTWQVRTSDPAASPIVDGVVSVPGPGQCAEYAMYAYDAVDNVSRIYASGFRGNDVTNPSMGSVSVFAGTSPQYQQVVGSTVYVNGDQSGSFWVRPTPTDPDSGVAFVRFHAPDTSGLWSPTTDYDNASVLYAQEFQWSAGISTAATGPQQATVFDYAQRQSAATTTHTIVVDKDLPAAGSATLTYPAGWRKTLDIPVTMGGTFTDATSSVASYQLQRADVPLSGSSCTGTYSFANIGSPSTTTLPALNDTTVTGGRCYRYRVQATDAVGHTGVFDPGTVTKVDNVSPTASIDTMPSVVGGPITISGTSADTFSGVASVTVRAENLANPGVFVTVGTDFTAVPTWSMPWDTTPYGGTWRLHVDVLDVAGNAVPDVAQFSPLALDNSPPTIAHTGFTPVTGAAYQWVDPIPTNHRIYVGTLNGPGSFSVEMTADDPEVGIAKVSYPAVGATSWTTPSTNVDDTATPYSQVYAWSVGGATVGSRTAFAWSNANVSSNPAAFDIHVDNNGPTGGTLSYPSGARNTNPVTIAVTGQMADSEAGIRDQQLQRDSVARPLGGTCSGATWPGTYATNVGPAAATLPNTIDDTTVATGMCYRYRILATDRVSNTATYTPGTTTFIDLTPATGSINSSPPSPMRGTVSVSGLADDGPAGPNSGVLSASLRWENLDTSTSGPIGSTTTFSSGAWTIPWDTTFGSLPDGNYRLHLDVTDVAGNVKVDAGTRTVVVDNSPPTLTFGSFVEGAPANCQHWAGGASTTFWFSSTGPCASGDFSITALATDPPGGVAKVSFPDASMTSNGFTPAASPADDASSPYSMHYTWGAGATAPGAVTLTAVGNSGATTSRTVTVQRDSLAPTGGSITHPGAGAAPGWWSNATSTNVAFTTGTDADSGVRDHRVQRRSALAPACGSWGVWTDISAAAPVSPYTDATIASGYCYQYRVVVADNVDNEQTIVDATRELHVDRSLPTGSVTPVAPYVHGTITIGGTAGDDWSGIASLVVQVNGGPTNACTPAVGASWSCSWNTTSVADGPVTLRLVMTDVAGNVGYATTTTTVDNAVPSGSVTIAEGANPAAQHVVPGATPKLWFNPALAGDANVTVAASDGTGSGIAQADFASAGAGWSRTPASGTVVSPGPYTVSYAWGVGAASPGVIGSILTDNAGNPKALPFELAADGAAPTGASIDYADGPTGAPSITFVAGADAASGIGAWQLQRRSTTVVGPGTCDVANWSAWTNVGAANPASPWIDGAVTLNTCYQYQLLTTDNVGNVTTSTDAQGDTVTVEPAGLVVVESGGSTAVAEGGAGDSYTVRLRTRPAQTVTVTPTPDAQVTTSPATLTFTTANWNTPQTVTVNAAPDFVHEATPHAGAVAHPTTSTDPAYTFTGPPVAVQVADDDPANVVVSPSATSVDVAEAGSTTDTYDLELASQPTANVTIALGNTDGQVTTTASSVTFTPTNWSTPQTVTVKAVDDAWHEAAIHPGVVTHTAMSSDPDYDGIPIADVTAHVADDDVAHVRVTPTTGLAVNEAGTTSTTYTVRLDSRPRANVTIGVSHDLQANATPSSLVFTDTDWNLPKTVTVTAYDDPDAEGPHTSTVSHLASAPGEPDYDNATVSPVTVNVVDDDVAGYVVTPATGLTATEGGAGSSYTIRLTSRPTANVTIGFTVGSELATIAPITFTATDWNTPQTIAVAAIDDAIDEPVDPHTGTIGHVVTSGDPKYGGVNPPAQSVAITDNDTAGLDVDELGGVAVDEANVAATDTFTVRLQSQPTANVTVTPTGAQVGASAPLVFTPANWSVPQVVTVTAVDDAVDEANPHAGTVALGVTSTDGRYSSMTHAPVPVSVADDDTANIVVSSNTIAVAEAGQTADTYTIRLASQPVSNVQVALTPDAQVTVTPASITFTPASWSTPQVVTVHGFDDPDVELPTHAGSVAHGVASADPNYASLVVAPKAASVTDNDVAGVDVDPMGGVAVTEGGATDTYRVRLTARPQQPVVVTPSGDSQVGTTTSALTFTTADWDTWQVVTVQAVDDHDVEPAHTGTMTNAVASADPYWTGITSAAPVSVAVTDDDVASVALVQAGPYALDEANPAPGTTFTYTAVLTARPAAPVTVQLTSPADLAVTPSSLTFTSTSWNTPQTVTFGAVDDAVDEPATHVRKIQHATSSTDPLFHNLTVADVVTNVADNDTAGVVVSTTSVDVTEGGAGDAFDVHLQSQPTAPVTVTLGGTQVSTSPPTLTFTPADWSTDQHVTVDAIDDDVDETPDPHVGSVHLALASADPLYDARAVPDVAANVTDDDAAGVHVTPGAGAIAVAEAGSTSATYVLVLDSQPTAPVTIAVTTADGQTTASPAPVVFTPANWSVPQTVTVTAFDDAYDEATTHPGLVTHTATSADPHYAGIAIADQAVDVTDDDAAAFVVTPTSGLTLAEAAVGTTASFTVRLASKPLGTVSVAVTTPDGQTSASPATLAFDGSNWNTVKTVTVTVVDDPDHEATSHPATIETHATSTAPEYASLDPADVTATIADDDVPDVIVDETGTPASTDVNESGATDTYELRLATRPTANVTIDLHDGAQATVSPTSITLTPTDWNTPHVVTVTGRPDNDIEGPHTQLLTHDAHSADPDYDGIAVSDVTAHVQDDDVAGVDVGASTLHVAENGASDSYDVQLTAIPSAPVTVHLAGDSQVAPTVTDLTFTPTNWNVAQHVTVDATDDFVDEPSPHAGTITHTTSSSDARFDGLLVSPKVVDVDDDDTAGVDVTAASPMSVTEGGAGASYSIVLRSKPTAAVDVSFGTGSQLQPIATHTFTPATWNVPYVVPVDAIDDQVAEGVHAATITHSTASADPAYGTMTVADATVAITDNDVASVLVVPTGATSSAEGGSAVSYDVSLTSEPIAPVTLTFVGDADGTATPTTITFDASNWWIPQAVSLTPVDDHVAEVSDQSVLSASITSADPTYASASVPSQTVPLTDNDVADVVFTPGTPGPVATTEGGAPGTYTVELATEPTADVTIDVGSLSGVQSQALPSSLTFTAATWDTPQTVTVTANDDPDFEPSPHADAVTHVTNSSDPLYAALAVPDMDVAITDNDVPGVHIDATLPDTSVTENGPFDVVHVALDTRPTSNVTVALSATGVSLDQTSLSFTPANWDTPQDVHVTALDDDVHQGPHAGSIGAITSSSDTAYQGVVAPTHAVAIADDDVAELRIDDLGGIAVAEAGTTSDTFTVRLGARPTSPVTVQLAADAQLASLAGTTLTFSPGSWNVAQTVTVQAAQDLVAEASPHSGVVTLTTSSTDPDFDNLVTPGVSVAVTDDDVPDVIVTEPSNMTMDEADSAGTERVVKVRLATQPSGVVTVTASNNGTLLMMNTAQLTFTSTNWNTDQDFVIRALDDQVAQGVTHPGVLSLAVVATSDPGYAALTLPTHTFAIADDDLANAAISCIGGANWNLDGSGRVIMAEDPNDPNHTVTCGVQLGTVAAQDVVVDVTINSGTQLQSDYPSVTIPAGAQGPAFITLTTTDDAFDEVDPHTAQVSFDVHSTDPVYDAKTIAPFDVAIVDNDTAGLVFAPAGPVTLTEGGAPQAIGVTLATQPTGPVDVAVAGGTQLDVTPAVLHFTAANWNQPQQVMVGAQDDSDDEVDGHAGTLGFTVTSPDTNYDGITVASPTVTITDNDTAGIVASATGGGTTVTEAGGTDDVSIKLGTRPASAVTIAVAGDAQVTAAPATITFTPADWSTAQTVHVGAVQDDLLEGDHTGTVTFTAAAPGDPAYATVTSTTPVAVTDDETAGAKYALGDGVKVVEGGATDTYTIALSAKPTGDVTIATAGGGQVTTAPAQLTFSPANWNAPQTITVTAVQDSNDEVDPLTAQVTHAATTTAAGWAGAKLGAVDVQVGDDDASGIVVTQSGGSTKVKESAKSGDDVRLTLSSQPVSNVTVVPAGDGQLDVDLTPIVLTPTNWKDGISFEVRAHDDKEVEGDHQGTVTFKVTSDDPGYRKSVVPPLDVAITDDDVDTDPTAGNPREDGGTRTPRGLPPATTTHTSGTDTGSTSVDTGRTDEGSQRTDEGGGDTSVGLGTIGNGVDTTGDATTDDETLLERRKRLEAETTAAREAVRKHHRKHAKSPIVKASEWVQDNWKVVAPVAGIGAIGAGGLSFLLRADPIKAAQRASRAARVAADAANRGARHPHMRLRGTKRKRDEEEADEDERDDEEGSSD